VEQKIIDTTTRLVDITLGQMIPFFEELIKDTIAPLINSHRNKPETIQIEELCLLYRWSKSAVYKKCSLRKIPHYKVDGGELRFNIDEINSWIKLQKCKTGDEVVADFEQKHKSKRK
jgi:hypothetical protein